MQGSELVLGLFDHALDRFHVGHAFRVRDSLAARLADFLSHGFGRACTAFIGAGQAAAQIVDDHFCALARRQQRGFLADAITTAGHEDHFAFQNAHQTKLPLYVAVAATLELGP